MRHWLGKFSRSDMKATTAMEFRIERSGGGQPVPNRRGIVLGIAVSLLLHGALIYLWRHVQPAARMDTAQAHQQAETRHCPGNAGGGHGASIDPASHHGRAGITGHAGGQSRYHHARKPEIRHGSG